MKQEIVIQTIRVPLNAMDTIHFEQWYKEIKKQEYDNSGYALLQACYNKGMQI